MRQVSEKGFLEEHIMDGMFLGKTIIVIFILPTFKDVYDGSVAMTTLW